MRRLLLAFLLLTIYLVILFPTLRERMDRPHTHLLQNKEWYRLMAYYRIPYATLAATIPNLNSLNPEESYFYIITGKEVPILYFHYFTTFGSHDYIEFYGKQN